MIESGIATAAKVQTFVEEPLFRSAHDALRFAYRFNSNQYSMTAMSKMMCGPVGNGKGLSGLDGAAQAGMITLMVKDLAPTYQASLVARYVDQEDRRFMEAVNRLTMDSICAVSGISHRHIRQALIARHFGHKVNLGEVAQKCDVHRNTIGNHQRVIRDYLRKVEDAAFDRITVSMKEKGLIE